MKHQQNKNSHINSNSLTRRSHKVGLLLVMGIITILLISSSNTPTSATNFLGTESDFSKNALPIPIVPPEGQGQSSILTRGLSGGMNPSLSLNHMEEGPVKGSWRSLAITPDSSYLAVGSTYHSNSLMHQVIVYQWSDELNQFVPFSNITE